MSWEAVGLALRVIVSLGLVLGLFWFASRWLSNGRLGPRTRNTTVDLLAHVPLTRSTQLAVVRVADRALVLGVSDAGVTLLTEEKLDSVIPETGPEPTDDQDATRIRLDLSQIVDANQNKPGPPAQKPAWTSALQALRDRTARR